MSTDLSTIPYSWVRRELSLSGTLKRRSKGRPVRAVQEWLNLHGIGTGIDGAYGPATEAAVRDFQRRAKLAVSGAVEQTTWAALTTPIWRAMRPISGASKDLPALVAAYARQHLQQHPREIGGQNCGPWVRLYTGGKDGPDWAWCAGFVTFLLRQAADTLDIRMPIAGSVSCDVLAMQAKQAGLFVHGAKRLDAPLPEGSIFLNRRTATDWTHTGIVTQWGAESFQTIEGNTNDEGSREGYEVCARSRAYPRRDFISLANWRKAGTQTVGQGTAVKLALTSTAANLIVKMTVMAVDGHTAPETVPLSKGRATIQVRKDTAYLLRAQLDHGPANGFDYTVDLSCAPPVQLLSPDGAPPFSMHCNGHSDTFSVVFEARAE